MISSSEDSFDCLWVVAYHPTTPAPARWVRAVLRLVAARSRWWRAWDDQDLTPWTHCAMSLSKFDAASFRALLQRQQPPEATELRVGLLGEIVEELGCFLARDKEDVTLRDMKDRIESHRFPLWFVGGLPWRRARVIASVLPRFPGVACATILDPRVRLVHILDRATALMLRDLLLLPAFGPEHLREQLVYDIDEFLTPGAAVQS